MSEPGSKSSRWRWIRSVSVASRLAASIVAVSVVSLAIATVVGLSTGRDLTEDILDDQLTGLGTTGAIDVAEQIASQGRLAEGLASSPQAPIAIDRFAAAHSELSTTPLDDLRTETEALTLAYREAYLDVAAGVGVNLDLRDIISTSNAAAIQLQYRYSLGSEVVEDPTEVDDAGDGGAWTETHQLVHPVYRRVVKQRDLIDLLMVEPDNGYVVYSTKKGPDLGTSLEVGPFSGSVISRAVKRVIGDPSIGTVVTDLSFYLPLGLRPVGAIASPVMDGEDLAGVIVLIYDSSNLTDILTADGNWDDSGFPDTGNTVLAAADGIVRSDPRSYLEDPTRHLAESVDEGSITEADATIVRAADTTVLLQNAGEAVNAGLEDDESVEVRTSMTGASVRSVTIPVPIEGLSWFVIAEVDNQIADSALDDFAQLLIVGTSIFVVAVAFAAVAWSSSILGPIREMSERLTATTGTDQAIVIPDQSPIEFHRLGGSFQSMVGSLDNQQDELAKARSERIDLLRRMLPPGIADRVSRGDLESIEEVPNASVVVIVVVGLGELVRMGEGDGNRELVDRLHHELDEIGERHGLERIKVVGDAYYAACGHNRPLIDHAPRTLSFAADAQDVIRELGSETTGGLDVVAGIHTGSVTVGMTLESRLVYDVWGPTVSVAHHLARLGSRSQILVSNATRTLLPETIQVEARGDDTPDDQTIWVVSTSSVGGRT